MLGFFNEDNFLYIFLMKVWDIVLMNLLFILCCIPIVTIGPALTAMYTCTLKMVKGNHLGTLKTFFRAFKQNFKQSFAIWMGTLVVSFILWTNYNFLKIQGGSVAEMLFYVTLVFAVILFAYSIYIYPVIAAFEGTVKMQLRNAFIFFMRKFGKTILMTLIWGFAFFITFWDTQLQPLYVFCWFFFLFSTLAYVCSHWLYKMFKPYLPEEEEPELDKYLEDGGAYLP